LRRARYVSAASLAVAEPYRVLRSARSVTSAQLLSSRIVNPSLTLGLRSVG
jgi:hypothetical protein